MVLEQFGNGWQEKFEERINAILRVFPNVSIANLCRRFGMLKVEFTSLDTTEQYVLDCVSYKIERESARICELCGKNGVLRRDPELLERQSLCWTCYALEMSFRDEHDSIHSSNKGTE